MGCGFELAIEALFDGKWVVIVRMYDGTCTGGYPLADAIWSLVLKHQIRGEYGLKFPYDRHPPVLWREQKTAVKKTSKTEGTAKDANEGGGADNSNPNDQNGTQDDEEDDEASDEEETKEARWLSAYYSREHVALIGRYCGPTLSKMDPTSRTYEQRDYFRAMPQWMDLARYAYPYEKKSEWYSNGELTDYYGEYINVIPTILKKQREIRQGKLTRMVTIALNPCLSEELCKHIAEYALPCATDVRLSWADQESYANDIRKGAAPPPHTGEPLPACTIM